MVPQKVKALKTLSSSGIGTGRVKDFYGQCERIRRSSRPDVFCKKDALRNFAKSAGKHLCQSLFFNKVAGLRPATLLKKRLWHRCFPVNFAKFLRTPFLTEHLWWLLLESGNWNKLAPIYKKSLPENLIFVCVQWLQLVKRSKQFLIMLL